MKQKFIVIVLILSSEVFAPDNLQANTYILNQNNSLFATNRTKISLGSAITERPKTKTATSLLCKHAYAVIKWLLINYKNVMKFI